MASTTNILDLNNRIDELEKNSGGGGSADSAKRSDIATEFSTETSYTSGNFVYHEGKLYQFNADHSAGAWDPTDVVEANVTDQIVSNASAIAGLTASDVAYDNTDSGLTATDVQGAVDEVIATTTPRTASGTTIGQLVSTIGQLSEEQKIRCSIYINESFVARFVKPDIYNCVYSSSNGTIVEISLDINNSTLEVYSCTGTSRTTTALAITTWSLFYQGTAIS